MIDVSPTLNRTDLIAREALAIERTALANERTFLSVLRTCFTFMIGGITVIKLFEAPVLHSMGWVLIIGAVGGCYAGWLKYRQTGRQIEHILRKLPFAPKSEKHLAIEEDLLED
jgi:putative membrane protein